MKLELADLIKMGIILRGNKVFPRESSQNFKRKRQ